MLRVITKKTLKILSNKKVSYIFFNELVCCDYDKAHFYQVFDENGQQIYTLEEKSDCCERFCCTNLRSLTVSLKDNHGDEVIRFERPFRCVDCPSNCCYPNKTQVHNTYSYLF